MFVAGTMCVVLRTLRGMARGTLEICHTSLSVGTPRNFRP